MLTVSWLILIVWATAATAGRDPAPAAPGAVSLVSGGGGNVKVRDCEPIVVRMCRPLLGYNATASPNFVGHETQSEAEHELNTFQPLLQYGCSSRLGFFLCAAYVPLCTEKVQAVIGPCRPLCDDVRRRCEPILNNFGFPWLAALNCSRFPPRNEQDHMCMEGPAEEEEEDIDNDDSDDVVWPPTQPVAPSTSPAPLSEPSRISISVSGCPRMRVAAAYVFVNRTRRCSLLCHESTTFSSGERRFAEAWITIWSVLCFLSTMFTVISFLIDSSRFRYPERAIVIIAFCYNVTSVGYIMRLLAGRDAVACVAVDTPFGRRSVLVGAGVEHTDCTVVFLLVYFFSMASCAWWVVLTLLWLLAAGLRWTREAIERHSGALHVVAWTPPAFLTVAVLVGRTVDADALTGVCHVGGGATARLALVVAPLAAFLVIGSAFLVAGLLSLCRVRRSVRRSGVETDRLEALMVRIGVFSLLYVAPAATALACYVYEHTVRSAADSSEEGDAAAQLSAAVLMLKVACSLIVGTTSGVWIWSAKTLHAWRSLFERLRGRVCGASARPGHKVSTVSGLLPRQTRQPTPAAAGSKCSSGSTTRPCPAPPPSSQHHHPQQQQPSPSRHSGERRSQHYRHYHHHRHQHHHHDQLAAASDPASVLSLTSHPGGYGDQRCGRACCAIGDDDLPSNPSNIRFVSGVI